MKHLPRDLARAIVRRDVGLLNDDIWILLANREIERELDDATLLDRWEWPFRDGSLFPPSEDLGPFEFLRTLDWKYRERVGRVMRPSVVTPNFGWIICEPTHLVHRGMMSIHVAPRPGFRAAARARRSTELRDVGPALNLRSRVDTNYGHFLAEILGGRIRLAEEAGLPADLPLLVSQRLAASKMFADWCKLARIEAEVIPVGDREYVRSDAVYFADTSPHSPAAVRYLQKRIGVPQSDPSDRSRLLILRPPQHNGRAFTNMAELSDLCRHYGIQQVSPETMSLEAQQELFSRSALVIGALGSANNGILFRRDAPLGLIEIFPPGVRFLRPWWFLMSRVLGHHYDYLHAPDDPAVQGKKFYLNDFDVNIPVLKEKIDTMLERLG